MNKSKHTGTKISEYPSSLSNTTNKKYKLLYDHFLMSYAPVNFGISTINKNYRIPIQALRDDIKYYIGIENAKGDWRNLIKIWSGDWVNEDKTKSYVYEWKSEEQGSNDYIIDKFKSNEDEYDRIFFIKNAPIPLESEQDDPAPESNKFVNKKYIDDRFNGIRKVTVDGTTLEIRPYPCVYEYSAMPSSINIVDTLTLEDGRTIKDCIEKNCLIFYIKLPTPTSTTLSVKANNVDTKWGFSGELTQLLSTAKNNADSGLIKCYAEYINGTFTVHCTNGMNLKPGEGGTVEIDTTDTIVDGSDAVPTSNAVYDHVKLHEDKNIHITSIERTSWNNKVSNISGDNFISTNGEQIVSLSLNTTNTITDSNTTVPTSNAVYDHVKKMTALKNFIGRCDIKGAEEEGKDYILFDDTNSPRYMSFSDDIICGSSFFRGQELQHFRIDLPNLQDGSNMFNNCKKLQHFDSNLSNLTSATNMFSNCSLTLQSVKNIADKISTVTNNASIKIGIASKWQGNSELTTAIEQIKNKGWSVTEQYTSNL